MNKCPVSEAENRYQETLRDDPEWSDEAIKAKAVSIMFEELLQGGLCEMIELSSTDCDEFAEIEAELFRCLSAAGVEYLAQKYADNNEDEIREIMTSELREALGDD